MIYARLLPLILAFVVAAGSPHAMGQVASSPLAQRAEVLRVAASLIGTQEKTGHNDGPIVEEILASVGLEKGNPYCAAFNFYCYKKAGLARLVPRTGWSPSWVADATWKRSLPGRAPPRPADSWGIYFGNLGRVGHTGLVEKWGGAIVVTIEANTSPQAEPGTAADRNGDGVWRKRRMVKQIYAVRDWIGG